MSLQSLHNSQQHCWQQQQQQQQQMNVSQCRTLTSSSKCCPIAVATTSFALGMQPLAHLLFVTTMTKRVLPTRPILVPTTFSLLVNFHNVYFASGWRRGCCEFPSTWCKRLILCHTHNVKRNSQLLVHVKLVLQPTWINIQRLHERTEE